MSFSKAKITRFNDTVSTNPSPADYNINQVNRIGQTTTSKNSKLNEQASPAAKSDSNSHISLNSAKTAPTFRTPTLPKKKKTFFVNKKTKVELLKYDDAEALQEKMVECHNKDQFIKDLTEQIEEMKEQLALIEKQKNELLDERSKLENDVQEVKEDHKVELQNAYLIHDQEVSQLKRSLNKCENSLLRMEETRDNLIRDKIELENTLSSQEKQHEETITHLNNLLLINQSSLEDKDKNISDLKDDIKRLEDLNAQLIDELKDKEFSYLASLSDMQNALDKEKADCERKLNHLKSKHAKEIERVYEETSARIKHMEENSKEASLLADMHMQEKCKDIELTWQSKVETMLQQYEYNLAQNEREINEIANALQQKIDDYNNLEKENADLSILYKELLIKFDDLGLDEELTLQLANCREEIKQLKQQRKLYEFSLVKTHETIETLKTRLLDSDNDVEMLKHQVKMLQLECDEKDNRYKDAENEIMLTQQQLYAQVDNYREMANKKIDEYKNQLADGEQIIKEQMLQDALVISNALTLLKTAEDSVEESEVYENRIQALNEEVATLSERAERYDCYKMMALNYEKEVTDLRLINKKYIERSGKYDELVEKYEAMQEKTAYLEDKLENSLSVIKSLNAKLEESENTTEVLLKQKQRTIEKLTCQLSLSLSPMSKSKMSASAQKENIPSPLREKN